LATSRHYGLDDESGDLANRFDLEFLGKSFPAHKISLIA
jgi:hypothetical protein